MKYVSPTSLEEVLSFLGKEEKARIMAGGTDLFFQLQRPKGLELDYLVDITRIDELKVIEEKEDSIRIGAAVTHTELELSPLIEKKATALAQGASEVGSPQVRNLGTVGGNIVNAAPAADTAVPLFALGAMATIQRGDGSVKTLPIGHLYAGINQSSIDSTQELVTSFTIRKQQPNEASAFARFSPQRALSLPIVNVALFLVLSQSELVEDIRIYAGPAGPTPFRLTETEKKIKGKKMEEVAIQEMISCSKEELPMRATLLRGSSEFRKEIGGVLVQRAFHQALGRIG